MGNDGGEMPAADALLCGDTTGRPPLAELKSVEMLSKSHSKSSEGSGMLKDGSKKREAT